MDSGGTTLVSSSTLANEIPLDHHHFKEETKDQTSSLIDLEQRDQNVLVLDNKAKTQIIFNKGDTQGTFVFFKTIPNCVFRE